MSTDIEIKGRRPVMLCVMDGWGHRDASPDNAVRLAKTPVFDRLWESCPTGFMSASGGDVGLPDGQMGNSEVGHMNLGAGRVVMQDLPRINAAVENDEIARMPALAKFVETVRAAGGRVHLVGLVSKGGVHAHQSHIAALARAAADLGAEVRIHAFMDGRDTPPTEGKASLQHFIDTVGGAGQVVTVIGRYWAMDRDKRWERVERAWRCMTLAEAEASSGDAVAAMTAAYARGETDEFVAPTVIEGHDGIRDGDGLLVANFRADRAREILDAYLEPGFDGFDRPRIPALSAALGMVEYSDSLAKKMDTLFPPMTLTDALGEVVADAGLKQLRIAETEKYPHVTFFLNGGREVPFDGEDRILIPSPKVATYDLQPEMSADQVTEALCDAIRSRSYDLIVVNFANPDMVGHTGSLEAAIKAVETVDRSVGAVTDALGEVGGCMLLTADHGNCELMLDPETGGPHTAHTTNPVPVVLVGAPKGVESLRHGRLADVAPTLLSLLGVGVPPAMTGTSLLETG